MVRRALLPLVLVLMVAPVRAQHGEPAHASKPVVDPKLAEVKPVSPRAEPAPKKVPAKATAAGAKGNDQDIDTVVARINQRLAVEAERRKRSRVARAKGTGQEPSTPVAPAPPMRVELSWRVPVSWSELDELPRDQGVDSQVITVR